MNVIYFLHFNYFLCFLFGVINMNDMVEVVLNQNGEILHTMIECGMLESLVDIFSNEYCDSETLV